MRIAEGLYRIDHVRGANAYLAETSDGLLVVDTGMPGNAEKIVEFVRGLGFKLTDVIIGIAQEKGLREISGYIDANNRRMLRVVEELGFVAEETVDCVTTVRLTLS